MLKFTKQKHLLFLIIGCGLIAIILGAYFSLTARLVQKQNPLSTFHSPQSSRSISQMWGEPAKSMFPDIEKPVYVSTNVANGFLRDDDLVMDVLMGETHYIYPINILSFHHIVNDAIDNKPIAVTFCLLSNSALVFSRKLRNDTLDVGVLGPLYFGNLVMYDKKTDSYIIQMTGEIFHGSLSGKTLNIESTPSIAAWKHIKNTADIRILSPEKPIAFYRDFYEARKGSQMGLQSLTQKGGKADARLDPYAVGIGTWSTRESAFVPESMLKEKGSVPVSLGTETMTVSSDKTTGSISISSTIPIHYTQAYWFSWSSFYPQTTIIE